MGLLVLAVAATALVSFGAVRAARGCGVIPLASSVIAPVQSTGSAPVGAEERERRAREVMADRFGIPVETVLVSEQMTQAAPSGATAYIFKLYGVDGRYFGPVFIDASGAQISEAELDLARVITSLHDQGKVEPMLSDAIARSLPWDDVPVMFQLVAPAWDGPPTPWPLDLSPDAWNTFVERHADAFYRPRVTPFVEYLRSIGARDINPDLAGTAYVKDAWVFARVPSGLVCAAAARSDVLRAGHNLPMFLN